MELMEINVFGYLRNGARITDTNEGDVPNDFTGEGYILSGYDYSRLFEGVFLNGKPDGYGILYSEDGRVGTIYAEGGYERYEGDFENGKAHGTGIAYYDYDIWYEGEFENGKPHGYGTLYSVNDYIQRYEGKFENGKFHGEGIEYYYYDGDCIYYKGEFENGKHHGKGKLYDESGAIIYEGEFEEGTQHGTGIAYFENGKIKYEGEFKNSKRHGKCKLYDKNGKLKYEGEFENGQPYGEGKLYDENGKMWYKGEVINETPNGKGISYYKNGNPKYEGKFEYGKYNGKGKSYYEDGKLKYEGEFKKGKPHGRVTRYYPNGCYYDANFTEGVENGEVVIFRNEGKKLLKCTFKDGEIINEAVQIHYAEDLYMRKVEVNRSQIPYLTENDFDIEKITINELGYGLDAEEATGYMTSQLEEKGLYNPFAAHFIDQFETHDMLYAALSVIAERELYIGSPWLSNWTYEDDKFFEAFKVAEKRGVKVFIATGIERDKNRKKNAIENKKVLEGKFKNITFKMVDSHFKFIVCDDKFQLVGSQNALSNNPNFNNWEERNEYSESNTKRTQLIEIYNAYEPIE